MFAQSIFVSIIHIKDDVWTNEDGVWIILHVTNSSLGIVFGLEPHT